MTDIASWIEALRRSHDRLAGATASLDAAQLGAQSACSEWSVAQVLSHLGSQAEIFSMIVDAGLSGGDAPRREAFVPVWEAWNARSPLQQAKDSAAANEALVSRIEDLDQESLGGFRLSIFGRDLDARGLLRMRLSEHAVHSWDVAVAFDPAAEVSSDAVELLVDGLGETAARSAKPPSAPITVAVTTSSPPRRLTLVSGDQVRLEAAGGEARSGPSVELPAEALLRLVYGRLDGTHPPRGPVQAQGITLAGLQGMFTGF